MRQSVRALVVRRAANCCEYCRVPQEVWASKHQIEHIVAKQHLRNDDPSNLALACDLCNAFKGTNLSSIDPATRAVVQLFNPRRDNWCDHFEFHGARIVGLTPEGRASVALLRMNDLKRTSLRALALAQGREL